MSESPARKFESLLTAGCTGDGQPRSQFWSHPDGRMHVQWYRAGSLVRFDPHTHSEFNIVVALEGAVETRQLGGVQLAEPGEAMMGSNPGIEHASWYHPGAAGCQAVSLTFTPDLLEQIFGTGRFIPAGDPRQPVFLGKVNSSVIRTAASEIATEMSNRAVAHEAIIEGLATRILVETVRLWPSNRIEAMETDPTPRLARRDHIRAFEFMRWCRKDAFRIQHLCRFLGTSEERFNRMFRAATQDSPAAFYNRLLLERGCALLADPSLSVKEISYELGFKTPSHFVVTFRRQFGRTPQDYRLAHAARTRVSA